MLEDLPSDQTSIATVVASLDAARDSFLRMKMCGVPSSLQVLCTSDTLIVHESGEG